MFGRLTALRRKHFELERDIEAEAARPLPDSLQLAEKKKSKLQVKDAMVDLARTRRFRRRLRKSPHAYPLHGV
tara:strand:+ start:680 stop:898 length:219 start_codon:yes stop_codon:yes gene_type:complete